MVVCKFDNLFGKEVDGVYMKGKTLAMWKAHDDWKESIGFVDHFQLFHPEF